MVKLYSWSGDYILGANCNCLISSYKGRLINYKHINYQRHMYLFDNLLLVKLLKVIYKQIKMTNMPTNIHVKIHNDSLVVNDNSMFIGYYKKKYKLKISSVITSPPYYNAKKYSHWKNFLCYLVDMMINAKSIYDSLNNHGIYIYNVGDIIDLDYIYIRSRSSRCKLMLGFYSILLFRIVGFKLKNNIIWDKGEVQSKRNSSPNHFAGYLKPINSYEHNLIFCKGTYNKDKNLLKNKVITIPPVKKINSRGENIYGHSAPFPKGIARLILPFSSKNGYILDPFLGSGTTCLIAEDNGYNSIGFEINKGYYKLALNKIGYRQLSLF